MKYKYSKRQLFGKKLKVPKEILNRVYSNTLTLREFIDYSLEDKIPISCLNARDSLLVERFGLEKCKNLDLDMLDHFSSGFSITSINPDTDNLNYEISKKILESDLNYRSWNLDKFNNRIKREFPSYFVENDDLPEEIKRDFYNNSLRIDSIIKHWNILKNKEIDNSLNRDSSLVDKNRITKSQLSDFMTKYADLYPILCSDDNISDTMYKLIEPLLDDNVSDQEKRNIITNYIENERMGSRYNKLSTEEEYKAAFKYVSIESFLIRIFGDYDVKQLLKSVPNSNYILECGIPFNILINSDVFRFISIYGLKNIVDFNNNCGNFFSKNNYEQLKLMYEMYIHYAGNTHDPEKSIYTNNRYDENGKLPYTKEEFYEAMRRMIVYGPTNGNYDFLDYRSIVGEFRNLNHDLFIDENAPEDLQRLFYTKSLTPNIIFNNKNYIEFLKGKNIGSCFKNITIKLINSNEYKNFYDFLLEICEYNDAMNFMVNYASIMDVVFDNTYDSIFSIEDNANFETFYNKFIETFSQKLIKFGLEYPKNIPDILKEERPDLFIDENAPEKLQELFYKRNIDSNLIINNPEYRKYLNNIDAEILFKYMKVGEYLENGKLYKSDNFINLLKYRFGNEKAIDFMLKYGKYIEEIYKINNLSNLRLTSNSSNDIFFEEINNCIYDSIIKYGLIYDELMPNGFKEKYPMFFIPENCSQEIKEKFYNKQFSVTDFSNDTKLFNLFENTNIACGFPKEYSWIIPLFDNDSNIKNANLNRLKVIYSYSNIRDFQLQLAFKEYVLENNMNIQIDKIKFVSEVLSRLSLSNSSEIFTFRKELATQILKSDDPVDSLNKIEDIFIKNNIPTIGKIYSCFEILHPDFEGFDFSNSKISPMLKQKSTMGKKILVFSDLLKSSLASNNRSINSYINNIEIGTNLYDMIKKNDISYDNLNEVQKKQLVIFSKHLSTLYNNTLKGKKDKEIFVHTNDVVNDIFELSKKLSFNGSLDYNLADRVISMFCHFAGIDTLDEAKQYINSKIERANVRNKNAASSKMVLEKGDFVKGIGGITYLKNILQNGSVSKEYLGSSSGSDATPLDTDLSMIMTEDGTTKEKLESTVARSYGPIWFVLKNDDRFVTTRTENGEQEYKNGDSRMEVFYTGALGEGHYGLRTGFASSEINYIVMDEYDQRVGLEIAMNGFYIPVANKNGDILFSPKDYDLIREKMSGLSYYGEENYRFSENLIIPETEYFASQIEESNIEVQDKKNKINKIIEKSLDEFGLNLKTVIDGNLDEGFVELIDTGSTGRGTNKPGDGDFDFMMRLDKKILSDPDKLSSIKNVLLKSLNKENSNEVIGTGDFRLKNVRLDDDTLVDIDITFAEKTDKVSYSTDMSLQDRFSSIKSSDPEKYNYVVSNILLAKQVLKQGNVYKPNRGENPQGGLGGVGIENWILQNGGSFIDAATNFIEASEGKSFNEFKSNYQIWDFGENHLAEKRGQYSHDNFISNNMSEEGYNKMISVLKEYINNLNYNKNDVIKK